MDRRFFLRAGALAGAAAALPATPSGLDALFRPVRGSGTPADPLLLNSNENPLGIGPLARAAAVEALAVANRYPDDQADALAHELAEFLGVGRDHVLLGNGSAEILQMAVQSLALDGARFVTAHPTFEQVSTYRLPLGTELATVPLDDRWGHDLERMRREAGRSGGGAVVYLCNPNNPTGTLTASGEMDEWIRESDEDTFFIVDEAYHELVDDPGYRSALPWARERPNVLVVRTFSKIYGMAGMRLGYGIGQPETVERIARFISDANTNQMAVAAASASLRDDEHVERSLASNRAAKALVMETLGDLGLEALPSQTNFVMHGIGGDVQDYIDRFAAEGILVGRPFPPMLEHNRVSLGTVEEMGRWAETLRDFRRRGWV